MTGDIYIYGGIGTERGEISFDNVNAQLNLPENKLATDLTVHIISPGGDVFEGEAIYNALKNTGKKITTHIEGTCASIATLIAGAGSNIIMNKTARFMIHNPKISGLTTAADSRDLRHVAEQLDQIKTLLINVYDAKTSLGKEKLWELYDNETWLTADEAEQMGFIDESVDAIKAVAKINLTNFKEMERKEQKGIFAQMVNLFKSLKIKNQATDTLQDGRVIMIMSDSTNAADWVGSQVALEDGTPLEAGDYQLASGITISVDANYTITAVTPSAPANDQPAEPTDAENKIKELEAKLAEALAANQVSNQALTTAKAENVKIENKVKTLEQQYIKVMEEINKTYGDTTPVNQGTIVNKATENDDELYDPMGEEFKTTLKTRNLI